MTSPFSGFLFPWQTWLRRAGRHRYRTVNLGVGGQTTAEMCGRIQEFLSEGQPELAVLFAGSVDAELFVDPAEVEQNLTFIIKWLGEHGVAKIALVGPGIVNLPQVPAYLPPAADYFASIETVRGVFRAVADRHGVVFVDLAQLLRDRIARGLDPDFSHVRYRQSRSWHAVPNDGHFNAYGQRLIAEAFLAAIADWPQARP